MRVLIIGGTSFFASYIVSGLLARGDAVTIVARGQTPPTSRTPEWDRVRAITLDRDAAEASGAWAKQMGSLDVDVIIDIISYRLDSARLMFQLFNGRIKHYLHCGTTWIYGVGDRLPFREDDPCHPILPYSQQKLEIQEYWLARHRHDGFPVTMLNPSMIAGAGRPIVTPSASFDQTVFRVIANSGDLFLAGDGMGTVHHVHASDVAKAFLLALDQPDRSIGQVFNVSSDRNLTYGGYLRLVERLYGSKPNVTYLPIAEWEARFGSNPTMVNHLIQHSCIDISKIRQTLGYAPAYDEERIIREVLEWLRTSGQVDLPPLQEQL